MRLLKTAEVRDIVDKLDQKEISFSKMVDMLNEIALKNLSERNDVKVIIGMGWEKINLNKNRFQ